MREALRHEIAARALVTLGALVPYHRLLTFSTLFVTDDGFTSDVFNGELPIRVLVGQMLRNGEMPTWTSQLCSGAPLAGAPLEPLSLLTFSLLSPAAALDLLVVLLLLVAAHGAYGLARRIGVERPGAVLAGIAFAGSGYIAGQLKHLAIVSTVVWLPVGLILLDRAFAQGSVSPGGRSAPPELARRALALALFGLVFAEQTLSGFPQSAYICGLAYAAFAVFRAFTNRQRIGQVPLSLVLLGGLGVATVLGSAAGAVVLLPLSELAGVSDRSQALGLEWSTSVPYWPPNILNFLFPYINGDISNDTYGGHSVFWEDYGYVGIATFLLAIYGADREARRPLVAFFGAMTLVAFLLVLGRATPVFPLAYYVVPGLKLFRFPTRFLIVVELGLAVLAGVGLTRLGADLQRRFGATRPRLAHLVVLSLCLFTFGDLLFHQPRQNPMVPAGEWLAPPSSVATIRADTPQPRTFTPHHRELHLRAFEAARGWADTSPYFALRENLPPNQGGGFWNLPSADCYAGVAPRWYVDVWGDHNRVGNVLSKLTEFDATSGQVRVRPALQNVMRTFGVTHVLGASAIEGIQGSEIGADRAARVYRIDGAARARFVPTARSVQSDEEAAARLVDPAFDPDSEVLLHDAPEAVGSAVPSSGDAERTFARARVVVTRATDRQIDIEVQAPADGFLLMADTFYPGWTATLDHQPLPIHRANISLRAVRMPRGGHSVRLEYHPPAFFRGLTITLAAVSMLLLWLVIAAVVARRRHV